MRWLLLVLLIPVAALAQDSLALPNDVDPREELQRTIAYSVPGMDDVRVIRNLPYHTEGGITLEMDVYVPPVVSESDRRPAVILIGTGAPLELKAKDWGIYTSYGRLVAASGMIAVTFNHRVAYGLKEGASDTRAAIGYVRDHADELNIDKDRVALVAFAGGGPLLSVAMSDPPAYIKCLVSLYAALDIRTRFAETDSPLHPDFSLLSPIDQLRAHGFSMPPMLLLRASANDELANRFTDRFLAEALKRNLDVEIINVGGARPGFEVLRDLPSTRAAIERVLTFLKENLDP